MAKSKDAQVEEALFRRCVGYVEKSKKPIKLKKIIYGENGRKISEEEHIEYTTEERAVEPNVTAIAMYLKNRLPRKWGNMPELCDTQISLEVLED